MSDVNHADELSSVTLLGEPTRRALYEFVVGEEGWVGRDRAADALGLERATAAHHLDRLAEGGLLEVDFRRLTGRSGPGAGRPAKVYRRAARDFAVQLPPRDYRLAGAMLADAADRSRRDGRDIVTTLEEVASERGQSLAEEIRVRNGGSGATDPAGGAGPVLEVLDEQGFEPRVLDDGTVVLGNCPFHELAQQHTELICGMNLCLLQSALGALRDVGMEARLEPEEGSCCVRLHPAAEG